MGSSPHRQTQKFYIQCLMYNFSRVTSFCFVKNLQILLTNFYVITDIIIYVGHAWPLVPQVLAAFSPCSSNEKSLYETSLKLSMAESSKHSHPPTRNEKGVLQSFLEAPIINPVYAKINMAYMRFLFMWFCWWYSFSISFDKYWWLSCCQKKWVFSQCVHNAR